MVIRAAATRASPPRASPKVDCGRRIRRDRDRDHSAILRRRYAELPYPRFSSVVQIVRKACRELPGTFPLAAPLIHRKERGMDAQSYSLRREHNQWIVCAAGKELIACADKRTA